MRFESEGGRKVREPPPPLPIFPSHFSFENERKNVVLRFSPPFLLKTRERKFFNCFEKKKTWSFLKELKYIFQLFFEKLILKKERERKKRERREEGKRKENETK